MSEVDSGYYVTEIRSLGNDVFKIILINSTTEDGFAIDIPDYSTVEDEDFADMLVDAVDSRLDELERINIDQAERDAESDANSDRKSQQAKKTDSS